MVKNNSYKFFAKNKVEDFNVTGSFPIIVAENIQSPDNIGAILRLAGNIGAIKVWFVYDVVPAFRKYKINRKSSGASVKVDWNYIKSDKLFKILPVDYNYIAVETTPDAKNIFKEKFPKKIVLFVGNERFGLSDEFLLKIKRRVYIPLMGPISSLNVSHALAIALFEWYRQQN